MLNKFILLLLIGLFFSFGCNACGLFELHTVTKTLPPEPTWTPLPPEVQADVDRINAMIMTQFDGLVVTNTSQTVGIEEVGAVRALGFVVDAPEGEVTINIYFFAGKFDANKVIAQLKAMFDLDEDTIVRAGQNGRALFFGYTKENRSLLNKVASAFAGEE
jgi:hypothetical protein